MELRMAWRVAWMAVESVPKGVLQDRVADEILTASLADVNSLNQLRDQTLSKNVQAAPMEFVLA
jgi:hypothetical protein